MVDEIAVLVVLGALPLVDDVVAVCVDLDALPLVDDGSAARVDLAAIVVDCSHSWSDIRLCPDDTLRDPESCYAARLDRCNGLQLRRG